MGASKQTKAMPSCPYCMRLLRTSGLDLNESVLFCQRCEVIVTVEPAESEEIKTLIDMLEAERKAASEEVPSEDSAAG